MTTEARQPIEAMTCFVCKARVKTSQGLHWHLRRDHNLSKEEAYEAVGRSLQARDASSLLLGESDPAAASERPTRAVPARATERAGAGSGNHEAR